MNHKYISHIEAFQITKETRQNNYTWPTWLDAAWEKDSKSINSLYPSGLPHSNGCDQFYLRADEGEYIVPWNYYIIKDYDGNLKLCDPKTFVKKYITDDS